MKNYFLKLKEVLIPFIIINVLTSLFWLLIYWLLIIKAEVNIKDDIVNVFVPIGLPWIPILIWFKPIIKKIKFKSNKIPDLYLFATWIIMFSLIFTSLSFMKTALGKLTDVKTISDLYQSEKTAYYSIAEYDLSNNLVEKSFSVYRSGKHNQYVNLDIFFTVPIVNKNEKLIGPKHYKFWMCQKFNTQTSSRKSDSEINSLFRSFERNTIKEYSNQKKSKYFVRLHHSEQKIQALEAIEKIQPGFNHDDVIILSPIKQNPKDKVGTYFKNMILSIFSGIVFFLIVLIAPKLKPKRKIKKSKKIKEQLYNTLSFIIPKGTHFISTTLIWINVIVFLIMILYADIDIMHPTGSDILNFGGAQYYKIIDGQVWCIITSIFVHAGIKHLVYNSVSLILAGIFAEPIFGRTKYLIIYMASGIIATISSVLWNNSTVIVGASGAIFGLFGAIIIIAYKNKITFLFRLFIIYAGINLMVGFFMPGVGNVAHISGLIFGAIIGYFMSKTINDTHRTV